MFTLRPYIYIRFSKINNFIIFIELYHITSFQLELVKSINLLWLLILPKIYWLVYEILIYRVLTITITCMYVLFSFLSSPWSKNCNNYLISLVLSKVSNF